MKNSPDNRKNSIPQWQVDKMKNIIADRWWEVWQIVEVRAKSNENYQYYEE